MHPLLLRTKARIRDATKPVGEAAVGALTIGMLRTTRYFDPIKTANLFGRIARSDRTAAARTKDRPRQSDGRVPGKIARGDRDHSRRRLGQSRPRRRRIRASRSHLGVRSRASRRQPHRNRAAHPELFAQLRLDGKPALIFRKPSRQLGTARAGRGRARAGCRRSCIAGPTLPPPIASSRRCAQ